MRRFQDQLSGRLYTFEKRVDATESFTMRVDEDERGGAEENLAKGTSEGARASCEQCESAAPPSRAGGVPGLST